VEAFEDLDPLRRPGPEPGSLAWWQRAAHGRAQALRPGMQDQGPGLDVLYGRRARRAPPR